MCESATCTNKLHICRTSKTGNLKAFILGQIVLTVNTRKEFLGQIVLTVNNGEE